MHTLKHLWRYWVKIVIPAGDILQSISRYPRFFSDWRQYQRLPNAEPLYFKNSYPQLLDATKTTAFDPHYFHQSVWAMELIAQNSPALHVDIGSHYLFVGMASALTHVLFVDIRPLQVTMNNFSPVDASILQLPFADNSVQSLSCLHVAEHIGLGRYGDDLDPLGTQKAARELTRILGENGNLYFSLPIGKRRVCFNAHRIHSCHQIVKYFSGLTLVTFSAVDDQGRFHPNIAPGLAEEASYACGLFWFKKRG